jgi:cofilin
MKLKKAYKFIVYNMNSDNTKIVIESTGDANATYEDFMKAMPAKECRYAVVNYEFTVGEGKREKIVFVNWAPDSAKVKPKMLFSSTKDSFKKQLVGAAIELQANDISELAESEMEKKCLEFARD